MDLVEVTWVDHAFHFGAYRAKGLMTISSTGYLVRQNADIVVLAQSVDENGTAHECLTLIASCVVEIRRLKRRKPS